MLATRLCISCHKLEIFWSDGGFKRMATKSKYGEKNIEQLKVELRKRGAKTSGRKIDLVERLEAYDRNADFKEPSTCSQVDVVPYKISLPDPKLYKDVLVSTEVPMINTKFIDDYLSQFDKKFDDKAKNLYNEKFVLGVRSTKFNTLYYIRGRCGAEMKKNIVYTVDIVIDENGIVGEAQCECGAGLGPEAHCKHICCVLYGISRLHQGEELVLQKTCTEKLQTFHKCKRFKGSPLKAKQLKLRKNHAHGISTLAGFDPRPPKFRKMTGYNAFFRNACINFQQDSRMSFLQLYPPANFFALYHDHDYFPETHESKFLEENNLKSLTQAKHTQIERQTVGQAKQPLWHKIRSMRISSSRFGRICKAVRTDMRKLASQMVVPSSVSSPAIRHGLKYESVAVKNFEKIFGKPTEECGTFVSITHPYLCSTPDRIIDSSTVLEVKCPYSARNCMISPQTVPYLKEINGKWTLNNNHDYYYQVQGQLYCSDRQTCVFFVQTLIDSKSFVIQRDEHFIQSMLSKLESFYNDHLQSEVIKTFMYKQYDKYTFDY